jgi:hypothetical protein
MIRRYDLRRSDNFPFVGRKSYRCSGDGYLNISTGFPVTSATITWSSVPVFNYDDEFSSSSSSSLSSDSIDSSSSSSSGSSSSTSSSSFSSSSNSSSSSSSLDSSSSSSSSSLDSNSSDSSNSSFSSSSSSLDSSSSSSSEEYSSSSNSSSSSSNAWPGPFENPRIYISEYTSTGFIVKYENIPEEIGYFEFSYMAF